MVLAVLACGAGFGLAIFALELVVAFGPAELPRRTEIGLDLRVIGFACAGLVAVLVAIGVVPAVVATGSSSESLVRAGSTRISSGLVARRLRKCLIAAEIAFTVVLMGTASLLLQSFRAVMAVDPGFVPEDVTTVELRLAQHRFESSSQWAGFVGQLLPAIAVAGRSWSPRPTTCRSVAATSRRPSS